MTDSSAHADGALRLDGDHERIAAYYRDWAADYDHDVMSEGYVSPMIVAGLAALAVPAETGLDVLDAGCGTGLVGRMLGQRRPEVRLHGVDLSPEMAERAEETGAYASVAGGVDLLDYAAAEDSPHFPLVLCSGTLTLGHIGIEGLDALLDLTEPEGHLAVSVRRTHSLEDGYPARVAQLAEQGLVEIVSELINAPYLENGGADYWLLRRL